MSTLLLVATLLIIIAGAFLAGVVLGRRQMLHKRGIWDMRPLIAEFDKFNQGFENLATSIASAFGVPLRFWMDDPLRRIPHEHPVDWVLRVGPQVSGHNITRGDAWRFKELRDWWTPDTVADEYGHYYRK